MTQEVERVPRQDQSTRRRGNHYMWFLSRKPGADNEPWEHGLGAEGAIVLADPVWGFQGCALLEGSVEARHSSLSFQPRRD